MKQYIWINALTHEILAEADTVEEIFAIAEKSPNCEIKGYIYKQCGSHKDL